MAFSTSYRGRAAAAAVIVGLGLVVAPPPASAATSPETAPHAPYRVGWTETRPDLLELSPATLTRWNTVNWDPWDTAFTYSYDVRVSRTPAGAARRASWQRPDDLQRTPATKARLDVAPGTVVCAQIRSRYASGPPSAWTRTTCLTRAFGAGSLRARGPVDVVRGPAFWRHRAKVVRYGGTLTLPKVSKGSSATMLLTYPSSERTVEWFLPGQTSAVEFSGRGRPVRHTVPVHYIQHAKRSGPLRIGTGGAARSLPIEGVALMPPWMSD